jgi:hypothetical protein
MIPLDNKSNLSVLEKYTKLSSSILCILCPLSFAIEFKEEYVLPVPKE